MGPEVADAWPAAGAVFGSGFAGSVSDLLFREEAESIPPHLLTRAQRFRVHPGLPQRPCISRVRLHRPATRCSTSDLCGRQRLRRGLQARGGSFGHGAYPGGADPSQPRVDDPATWRDLGAWCSKHSLVEGDLRVMPHRGCCPRFSLPPCGVWGSKPAVV